MKLLVITYFFIGLTYATTIIPLNENQILDASDFVVIGSIINKITDFGPMKRNIFTTYKVKINDFLYPCDENAGNECVNFLDESSIINRFTQKQGPHQVVYIRVFGGVIDNITKKVPGAPVFEVNSDKEFVFILRCISQEENICENSIYTMAGFNQGLCKIEENNIEKILNCNFHEPHDHNNFKSSKIDLSSSKKQHYHNKGSKIKLNNFRERLKERSILNRKVR